VIDLNKANLNLLVVFDILMKEQNLTKTGQYLHLSQPAISHALKGLRDMFNDELFVKGPGGMRPTDHALRLIEPLRQALGKIESVINIKDTFDPNTSNRVFQLGLSDYAAFILLPPLVAQLAHEAPAVSLDVQHINKPEKSQMIENGDIEMAIALFDKEPKRLEYQELFEEKLVCIADKDNKELKNGLTLERFVSLPHLLISFSEEPVATVQRALTARGLKRHVALKVRHVVPAGYVVCNSSLIAVLPERLALFLEKIIGIKIHEIPMDLEPQKVMMVWHKRSENDASVAWLRSRVREVADWFERREFKDKPYDAFIPIMRSVIKNDEEDVE
jgi:DNA-binding transcriptional LysR family regulator